MESVKAVTLKLIALPAKMLVTTVQPVMVLMASSFHIVEDATLTVPKELAQILKPWFAGDACQAALSVMLPTLQPVYFANQASLCTRVIVLPVAQKDSVSTLNRHPV